MRFTIDRNLGFAGKPPLEVTLWHGAGQTVRREAKSYRNIR